MPHLGEQALIEVVEAIPHPLFLTAVAEDGFRLVKLNKAYEALTGLRSEAIAETLLPMSEADNDNCARRFKAGQTYAYDKSLRLAGKDMRLHVALTPVQGEAGGVRWLICAVTDLTAPTGLEPGLEQGAETDRKAREALNEDLNRFTVKAAHDLRSPLDSMAMLIGVLADGFKDLGDGKLQIVEACDWTLKKLIKQADAFIRYARLLEPEGGEASVVDLGLFFPTLHMLLDPGAQTEFQHSAVSVEAEALALEMCFRTLLDAAFKSGAGQVRATVAAAPGQAGYLRCLVSDDGAGERLGDHGLAAMRHLVQFRGGRLWFEAPAFETGATVCFTLPGRILSRQERLAAAKTRLRQAKERRRWPRLSALQ